MEKPSAKQRAEAKTKKLEKDLQLTQKQYKKVLSLYQQEESLVDRLAQGNTMQGGPGMGGPGGNGQKMGGPGMGGPGMGGPGGNGQKMGGPGMGGPGGNGQKMGGPGMGGPGGNGQKMGGPGMGGPGGMPPMIDIENDPEMQAFQEKKEKKMRKILTEEQYSRWEYLESREVMGF